jgi:hypothetical protein
MSTPPNASNRGPAAAVPVAGQPARRKWLLPLLLGLLALIALIALLSRCGNDDPKTPAAGTSASPSTAATTAAATASPSATATAGPTGAATDGQTGAVTSGGDNLLGATGGGTGTAASLRAHDGEQAVGRAVQVQSVPADEGFWVGTSAQDRLWVQLTGTRGESDYKVKEGDTIDFTGTVTPAAKGFATEAGLTAAEGANQLTSQGYYVAAPASSVKLSS